MVDHVLQAIEHICNRLTERRVTLFLGAGVNFGLTNAAGQTCPLGQQLANLISADLLESPDLTLNLDDAAEIARHRVGNRSLNTYLYDLLTSFKPSPIHLALTQLPWDSMYTTNYDLLVEHAAIAPGVQAAGKICPIFSLRTDLNNFREEDILYYKLHGSIDVANTEEGRLILTKEDYRYYEQHRAPLFKRLKADLTSHTFVFLGYSMADSNLRSILEDCRNQLGVMTLPRSFIIRRGASNVEQSFWRDKYNIEMLNSDGADFVNLLKGTWLGQQCSVVPFDVRRSRQFVQVDPNAAFEKIGESFYRVDSEACSTVSNAARFFKGGEPLWGDIRAKIAPPRDAYYTLLDSMIEELTNVSAIGSVYCVTGAAGVGKTTLIRTLAYDVAHDTKCPVLVHIPGTPLDAKCIGPLIDPANPERVLLIIPHAAESIRAIDTFVMDIQRLKLPVTIVLEERKNQWNAAIAAYRVSFNALEVDVPSSLSEREIPEIIQALEKHNALGRLTGMPLEEQVQHFEAAAEKELLVALREITTNSQFDDIIRDEYHKIPTEVGKQAYLYVSALGQLDLPIRFETLQHLLGIEFFDLGKQVLQPTEGILVSLEDFGVSRHNAGFRVRTRHPIIASVIFATGAADDDAKFKVISAIIDELDPGYSDDSRLLEGMTRRKALVGTLSSPILKRSLYDKLETVLPRNPYVLQHRSILEKDLSNSEASLSFARKAVQIEPHNPALQNTLGFALEFAARSAPPLQRDGYLSEATKIFESCIRRSKLDAYAYLGRASVLRTRCYKEQDVDKRKAYRADILSVLEEGYESTNESPVIAGELAREREAVGSDDDVITLLTDALSRKESDERLRSLLVQFQTERGELEEALKVATKGEKLNPTAWRLLRQIARLKNRLGHSPDAIRAYYDGALRHNQGDADLLSEYGAFLLMGGRLQDAEDLYRKGRDLKISSAEKNKYRSYWLDGNDRRVFNGNVIDIQGGVGTILAIPENFQAIYWRTRSGRWADLRKGASVRFIVAFTVQGPRAEVRF